MIRPLIVIALTLLASTAASAQFRLISVEQEIDMGRRVDAEVRREMAVLRDEEVAAYVRSLGRRLAQHAQGPKYPYRVSVVDYREINAFALPGGPIWVHRG